MNDKGLLIIFSGPSGTGKSTVISRLMELRGDIRFSISATTRAPRAGEEDGKHYYFISRDAFMHMIDSDAFLEHAEYVGNFYGTPAAPVDENLNAGYNVLLDIEIQGAMQVLERRPDAVSIFLSPPSIDELEKRLRSRGTDSEEKILGRLQTARNELAHMDRYSHVIVNDNIDAAANELNAIITAERNRVNH